MLSPQQITFYQTFGFLILRNLLTQDELTTINREYEIGFETAQRNSEGIGIRKQLNWSNLHEATPFCAGLLEDQRFCSIAEQLYGSDIIGMFSNANHFGGTTEWHPDTVHAHYHAVKFTAYLQPIDADSGALRVIPGSHQDPFHEQLHQIGLKGESRVQGKDQTGDGMFLSESGLEVCDIPAHVCATQPGDVIAFNLRAWHASWGGSSDRRMCSLLYSKAPETAEEMKAAKLMAKQSVSTRKALKFPSPQYSEYWLANTNNSDQRARWIDWLWQLGHINHVI